MDKLVPQLCLSTNHQNHSNTVTLCVASPHACTVEEVRGQGFSLAVDWLMVEDSLLLLVTHFHLLQVSCNYEPHLRGNVYVQFTT